MSSSSSIDPNASFEQAISRLEAISGAMEDRSLSLDEMISGYEEGSQLLKLCRVRLEQARLRVEQINLKMDSEEAASLTPFDTNSSGSDAEDAEGEDSPVAKPIKKNPPRRVTNEDSDSEIRLF